MVKFERVADGRLEQVWVNDRLLGHINQKGTLLIDPSNMKDYVGVIGITEGDLREIFERASARAKIYKNNFSGDNW